MTDKFIVIAATRVVGTVTEQGHGYATYSRAVAIDGTLPGDEDFRGYHFMGFAHHDGAIPGEWTIRISKRPGYRHSEDISCCFIWTPWTEVLNRLPDSIIIVQADHRDRFLHICAESKIATQVYECGEVNITPPNAKLTAA